MAAQYHSIYNFESLRSPGFKNQAREAGSTARYKTGAMNFWPNTHHAIPSSRVYICLDEQIYQTELHFGGTGLSSGQTATTILRGSNRSDHQTSS